jgi:hypothetical protein
LLGRPASTTVLRLYGQQALQNTPFRFGEIAPAQACLQKAALNPSLPCTSIGFELQSHQKPSERITLDIRPLSDDEEVYRQDALALAAHYLDSATPLPIEKVQELYQVVTENFRHYDKAQIAVGIAFGETIAEKTGWQWVRITDEYGAETSLSPPGYTIACHPISMIQKRIADNEQVDLAELRDETINVIERRIEEGMAGTRKT